MYLKAALSAQTVWRFRQEECLPVSLTGLAMKMYVLQASVECVSGTTAPSSVFCMTSARACSASGCAFLRPCPPALHLSPTPTLLLLSQDVWGFPQLPTQVTTKAPKEKSTVTYIF